MSSPISSPKSNRPEKFAGAYVEPRFMLDHAMSKALDVYQHDAGIGNLFFRGYVFHNDPDNSETGSHGAAFFTPDPKYYHRTFIKDFQDARGGDLLRTLIQASSERGMNVYFYLFPAKTPPITVAGYERVLERDIDGAPGWMACWRHPDYYHHLYGVVQDLINNHDALKGIMWGAERCGPLGWISLGKKFPPSCFCEHCCSDGRALGIDVERAREGWRKLDQLFQGVRSGNSPAIGIFANVLRLFTDYPEILAWEKLFWNGKKRVKKEIYRMVKEKNPAMTVGHHLWHRGTFSIFSQAALNYDELCEYADFIKPSAFSNPASFRFKEQVDGLKRSFFGDLEESTIADMLSGFLQQDREAEYEELLTHGFGSRYVYREMEKAVKSAAGRVKIYAGIAAKTYTGYRGIQESTDSHIAADLRAARQAGVDGVIFGSVDMLKHARGIGQALARECWIP